MERKPFKLDPSNSLDFNLTSSLDMGKIYISDILHDLQTQQPILWQSLQDEPVFSRTVYHQGAALGFFLGQHISSLSEHQIKVTEDDLILYAIDLLDVPQLRGEFMSEVLKALPEFGLYLEQKARVSMSQSVFRRGFVDTSFPMISKTLALEYAQTHNLIKYSFFEKIMKFWGRK